MDPYYGEETIIPPNPIFSDEIKEKLKKHRESMLRRRSTDTILHSAENEADTTVLAQDSETTDIITFGDDEQSLSDVSPVQSYMNDNDGTSDDDVICLGDSNSNDPFVKYYSTFGTDDQLARSAKAQAELDAAKHDDDDGYMSLGEESESPLDEEDRQADGVEALLETLNDASPPGIPPWLDMSSEAIAHRKHSPVMTRLHNEILDFCDYIAPTEAEEALRRQVVERVTQAVQYLWPEAKVAAFGSLLTGLYLPFADVDLVIIRKGSEYDQQRCEARQRSFLKNKRVQVDECDYSKRIFTALAKHMRAHGQIAEVEIIAKARIPIIKFVDVATGFKVDICLNVEGGVETGQYMLRAMESMPALKPLTLVLKYFLQCRTLNETYTGGVGSFLLQCMLVSMLQRHPTRYMLTEVEVDVPEEEKEVEREEEEEEEKGDGESDDGGEEEKKKKKKRNQRMRDYEKKQREAREAARKGHVADIDQHVNLGVLLYSFFDMFVNQYNYFRVTLAIAGTGSTYRKQTKKWGNPNLASALSIENPVDADHDVAANSFQIPRIRQAFLYAMNVIQGAVRRSVDPYTTEPEEYTILQHLLPLCPELLQVRPARVWEDDEWEKAQKAVEMCNDVETVREANRREIFSTVRLATAAELEAMKQERRRKEQVLKEAKEKADAEKKEKKKANKQAKKDREKAARAALIQQDLSRFDDDDDDDVNVVVNMKGTRTNGSGSAKAPVYVDDDGEEVEVADGIVDFGKKAKKDTKKKEKKEKEKEREKEKEKKTKTTTSTATSTPSSTSTSTSSASTSSSRETNARVADLFGLQEESDDGVIVVDVKRPSYDEGDGDSVSEEDVSSPHSQTQSNKRKVRDDDEQSDDDSLETYSDHLPQSLWLGEDGEAIVSDLDDVDYIGWDASPDVKASNKKKSKTQRLARLKQQQQVDGRQLVTLAAKGQKRKPSPNTTSFHGNGRKKNSKTKNNSKGHK